MKPVPAWKALAALVLWQIYDWIKIIVMSIKTRFALASATAILAAIVLFNINSYFADKHNIGSVYIIVGFALALLAVYQFWTIAKDAGTGPDRE